MIHLCDDECMGEWNPPLEEVDYEALYELMQNRVVAEDLEW